jgi:hypothetical protein
MLKPVDKLRQSVTYNKIGTFALGLRPSPYWSKIDEDVYLGCLPTFWNQHLLSDLRVRAGTLPLPLTLLSAQS